MDAFTAGDPLRGLGFFLVVLTHVGGAVILGSPERLGEQLVDVYGWVAPVFLLGPFALAFFFGLSGYLIGRPFIRAYLRGRPTPAIGPYVRNRLLRILPAFWFAFALSWLIFRPTGELWDFAASVLLAQNYHAGGTVEGLLPQAWSVDVEMAFYLLLPVVALLLTWLTPRSLGRAARAAILCALVIAAFAVSAGLWVRTTAASPSMQTLPLSFWYFAPGLLLAIAEPFALPRLRGTRTGSRLAWAIAALGLLATVAFCVVTGLPVNPSPSKGLLTVAIFVAISGGAIVAPMVRQWTGLPSWRVLDNRPLRWLGERAYSLYLLHFIPLKLLQGRLDGLEDSPRRLAAVLFLMELAVVIPMGALSYRFVERPFLNLKRRRRSGSLTPVPGSVVAPARAE